ncbi:MAG: hypothetical protein PF513_04040 [Tenericutes bacterium]|jgi:hypothetical protein|nr:hypothetical protein [Mycoplasmatota bacterium]
MPYSYFLIELEGVEKTIKNLTYDPYVRGYLKHLKTFYMSKNYEMLYYVINKLLYWYSSETSGEDSNSVFTQFPYSKTKEILLELLNETEKLVNDINVGS